MKIERINLYNHLLFSKEVLNQHGAYLIDDKYPCQFTIVSKDSAIVTYHDYDNIEEIIDKFRFYAYHITKFYNLNNELIKQFEDVPLKLVNINKLQPSQFYVDEEKLQAISSWAKTKEHFIIPIHIHKDDIIILDGHTRLYLANLIGLTEVYVYEDETDDYIYSFVSEAKKRNIYSINDLSLVSHEGYIKKWHDYCDEFFRTNKI